MIEYYNNYQIHLRPKIKFRLTHHVIYATLSEKIHRSEEHTSELQSR